MTTLTYLYTICYYELIQPQKTPMDTQNDGLQVAGNSLLKMAIVVRFLGCRFTSSLRSSLAPQAPDSPRAPVAGLHWYSADKNTTPGDCLRSQLACKSAFGARCFFRVQQKNANSHKPPQKNRCWQKDLLPFLYWKDQPEKTSANSEFSSEKNCHPWMWISIQISPSTLPIDS